MTINHASTVAVRPWWRRLARAVAVGVLGLAWLLLTVWASLLLWFQAPVTVRLVALVVWLGISGWSAWQLARGGRWRRAAGEVMGVSVLALGVWWQTLLPSHDRPWADDVARLLQATQSGSTVTLRNVRDFDWRSETDYDARWVTREYDLDDLVSADLLLSYWMGPAIAHTLVSFGFADGRQLVFSLEIRKEREEQFSALAGFFRRYETVIIAAEESDIVRVRTNVRGETVQMYRLNLSPMQLRTAFLGYLAQAAEIEAAPQFYNTLTSNCTTIIWTLARQLDQGLPMDVRVLLSGYFDRYAYAHGGLDPGYRFETLQAGAAVSPAALAYQGPASGFAAALRQAVPGIDGAAGAPDAALAD